MSRPSEPGVALLPVLPDEAEAVSEMAARIWPTAYGAILPPGQIDHMLAWMYDPERLRRELAEGILYLWIGQEGERVGFLAAGPVRAGSPCPLHKFYLLPEAQGRGLGGAAMALLRERIAAAEAVSLELRVNRNNAPAIRFYKKHGFTTYAEDRLEIGDGFAMDDYLMRLPLKP